MTGGGWYVNANGIWGSGFSPIGGTNLLNSDDIGIDSRWVQWYQANVITCSIKLQQAMFIDAVNGPVAYNTGSPYGASNQLEIDLSGVSPANVCTNVTPNGTQHTPPICKNYPGP